MLYSVLCIEIPYSGVISGLAVSRNRERVHEILGPPCRAARLSKFLPILLKTNPNFSMIQYFFVNRLGDWHHNDKTFLEPIVRISSAMGVNTSLKYIFCPASPFSWPVMMLVNDDDEGECF